MQYNNKLTPNGANWITTVLDPFHDSVTPILGLPDEVSSPSYTRVHVQSVALAANAAGDSIKVLFTGVHSPNFWNTVYSLNRKGDIVPVGPTADYKLDLAPIIAVRSATGVAPSVAGLAPVVGTSTALTRLVTTPDNLTPSRLIGLAIEVHDTTAQLARQGTVSVSHCPSVAQHNLMYGVLDGADGWDSSYHNVEEMPPFPESKSIQALDPHYAEWESAKGVYIVARMVTRPTVLAARANTSGGSVYYPQRQILCSEATSGSPKYFHHVGATMTDEITNFDTMAGAADSGFRPFSIIFDGLAATTTYRMTVRSIVEYFPTLSQPTTLPNAIMAPPYDPIAFALYQHAVRQLPPAVPVGYNASGDWWRIVSKFLRGGLGIAAAVAPSIGTAFGQPALGTMAGQAASLILANMSGQGNGQNAKKKKAVVTKQQLSIARRAITKRT